LGKILRTNFPVNQIDLLQILANEGVSAKLTFKNLKGEVKNEIHLIWSKHISQKDTRYVIRVVLEKLKLREKFELGVLSILKDKFEGCTPKIYPFDIIEPVESTPEEKIKKWETIRRWSQNPETSEWAKYGEIPQKYFEHQEQMVSEDVIKEFRKDLHIERSLEVILWTTEDVNKFIGSEAWDRSSNNIAINKGNEG
jgi:hypothetical protein